MRSIQSHLLTPFTQLTHAFSTKENGYSLKPFSQNNLAYHVHDNSDLVLKNHKNYAKYLDYDVSKLVHMEQVHGSTITLIDKTTDLTKIPKCDALITKEKNIPLMVMVADCIPILVYDPKAEVIAVVHAGRAGVFNQILIKTIKKMETEFNTDSKNLRIVLGPSIRQCCYEVGKEIKDETKELNYSYAIKEKNKTYYLDLVSIIKHDLKALAIEEENIETIDYCTSCNKDIFFSYRAEKNNTGRFSGLLMLK